jgi:uncharacterized membrane protein YphA (DoxX/SURF4 family)
VLRTDDSSAPLFLRLGLGSAAMLLGGTLLVYSCMGEGPPTSISERLAPIFLVPVFLSIPVIVVLTLGGLLLVLGWFVRAIASLTALVMVPRLCSETGLLWSDEGWAFSPERIGFYLLALAAGIALSITGGGRLSADRMLIKQ